MSRLSVTAQPAFSPLRLSTVDLPASDRFEACSEIFKKVLDTLSLNADDQPGFRAHNTVEETHGVRTWKATRTGKTAVE